jgi:hypothetical protein
MKFAAIHSAESAPELVMGLVGGSSQRSNLHFSLDSATGSESVLKRENVTGNSIVELDAPTLLDSCDVLRFQFCEIHSNTGQNCITIRTVRTALIRCISVCSNIVSMGLFFVITAVMISESAIAGNSAALLVRSGGFFRSCLITFYDCHFDNSLQTATGANLCMVNCATDAAGFVGLLAVCLSRTHS